MFNEMLSGSCHGRGGFYTQAVVDPDLDFGSSACGLDHGRGGFYTQAVVEPDLLSFGCFSS